ncbi:MAG: TIGR03790 family protein [Armatimonadetes bacterium]|nr:TIGR03790 family protein [Armatimonadota bacterium]
MAASMLLSFALLLAAPRAADPARVVVVENTSSPASVEIAEDYVSKRSVKNLVKVECQDSATSTANETMTYANFQTAIEAPVLAFLSKHPKVDFIVLTKGVPIRLTDAPFGMANKQPSLDSALAATGYAERKDVVKVVLSDSAFSGKCWVNRFWNSTERFSHEKFGGYLVTRLDGYTTEEAKMLVTYAVESEKSRPTGKFFIDVAEGHGIGDVKQVPQNPVADGKLDLHVINEMAYNDWDADMVVAGQRLAAKGVPLQVDRTDVFVGRMGDLMGYCSWGSNDPKFDAKAYSLIRFAPGGIAETAVSTSARTFLPTQGGQSLIADLVHGRATGVKGYCDEPLLQAVASPSILFERYASGWTLAESYYAASRFVGWEDIVIGDPLCAPYSK